MKITPVLSFIYKAFNLVAYKKVGYKPGFLF
jgi:hypothetical protein